MTRVVVDARLSGNSGVGRYLDCLLHEFQLRPRGLELEFLLSTQAQASNAGRLHRTRLGPYSKLWQLVAPVRVPRAPVFWTPHWNHPLLSVPGEANVVTVHDVMPLRFPDLYRPFERALFRRFIAAAVGRRYQLITVSAFSAHELLSFFPAANVEVIVNGATRLPEGDAGVDGAYFLCVGNVKPHKNLPFAIRAFRLAKARGMVDPSVRLVVAGATAGLRTADQTMLSADFRGADVVLVEGPSDRQLGALYAGCIGLIAASLYEGFGLPLVEAMQCGKVIVCSDIPAFREVAGDLAHYFDPTDPDHFAVALGGAYGRHGQPLDYTATLASFSWAASADAHGALFARLAEGVSTGGRS